MTVSKQNEKVALLPVKAFARAKGRLAPVSTCWVVTMRTGMR